jgi:hypothetical protein
VRDSRDCNCTSLLILIAHGEEWWSQANDSTNAGRPHWFGFTVTYDSTHEDLEATMLNLTVAFSLKMLKF